MPEISSTSLPIASFTANRQEQNLPSRQGQDSGSQLQNTGNDERTPSRSVFRGEVLQQPDNQDRRYRPQFNQDIDPQNREAISSYQQIGESALAAAGFDSSSGRIVDFFI